MSKKYVDLETLKYLLYDIHSLENLLSRERFQEHDMESLNLFIDSVKEFSDRELYPYFKEMDETPAYHKDGKVIVHKQVETVMRQSGEMGIIAASFNYEDGGLQIPFSALQAAVYVMDAANNHLPGYPKFNTGGCRVNY